MTAKSSRDGAKRLHPPARRTTRTDPITSVRSRSTIGELRSATTGSRSTATGSRSATADPGTAADRAQTPIDFAVGSGIFLITVAFVIAFVPSLFDPFSAAESATPLVADRIAAGLAGDLLVGSVADPGVLSPGCTVAFFTGNASLGEATGCGFDADREPNELFGTDANVQVIVHELNESSPREYPLEATVETRHGTSTDVVFFRTGGGSGTVDPTTVDPDDVTVSGRIVSIDGDQYRLTVRVW